jgi:hypothetical protein
MQAIAPFRQTGIGLRRSIADPAIVRSGSNLAISTWPMSGPFACPDLAPVLVSCFETQAV